jgi:nucleoside-diphosphate-sugar epimerase
VPGDVIVLGASGKMGPSLSRMLRRARDEADSRGRVIAVARFSSAESERRLQEAGVETMRCDLADRAAVARLPDAPNVVFMAGQKFGTTGAAASTWSANTIVPAIAAERYAGARIVAFSTGNVYPLSPVARGGPSESDPVGPVGEYAMSCLGRERVLEYFSATRKTRVALIRLNYAVDLRYGVLVDVAQKVRAGAVVDLRMGFANVIWQGDANAWSIRALELASTPPTVLNVTGRETLSIRAVADRFGEVFGRPPRFEGVEAPDALLSDARRAAELFGPPTVDTDTLVTWVGEWIRQGGSVLGKPTGFEKRDGRF